MLYKQKLKQIREEQDLKSRDIDKILNLKCDTYKVFESERTIMPIKHLNDMANYFNVSLDFIFSFTNIKNYNISNKDIDPKIAGTRLKEFRKEQKLTQEKLSDDLKILQQAISKYEKGKSLIATPYLYTICKKYHISADYLLGKTDEPKYLK